MAADAVVTMYRAALPRVYGYLLPRCGSASIAEDLTAETFLAAVDASRHGTLPEVNIAWLIGTARHKLVDHWRRESREARHLQALPDESVVDDDVEARFERARAHEVLEELGAHHCAALTLRYLDGLSVPEVAEHLGRTVHATEALLVRARNAFRVAYARGECDDD